MSGSGTMPADDDWDVDASGARFVDDEWSEGHVRARQHRQADGVDVFVDRRSRNGRWGLEQTRVDHFVPGVAQDAGDDLDAAVMAVEADLGDQIRCPGISCRI